VRPFALPRLRGLCDYPAYKLTHIDYELYWRARAPWPYPPRVYVIASLLERGSSVFDVGCGDGELFDYAASRVPGLDWQGLDISAVAVERAQAKGMRADVTDVTAPGFALAGTYDYIVISEVLEHISDPERLLDTVRAHYRKGLILTVPNICYYKHRIRALMGRFPVQWQWHPAEHIRFWSLADFRQLLSSRGLLGGRMITTNGFPFERRVTPRWHRLWPNLLAEGAVFVVPPQV